MQAQCVQPSAVAAEAVGALHRVEAGADGRQGPAGVVAGKGELGDDLAARAFHLGSGGDAVVHRRDDGQCLVDTVEVVGEQVDACLALADMDVADVRADQRHGVAHVRSRLLEPSEVQQELR